MYKTIRTPMLFSSILCFSPIDIYLKRVFSPVILFQDIKNQDILVLREVLNNNLSQYIPFSTLKPLMLSTERNVTKKDAIFENKILLKQYLRKFKTFYLPYLLTRVKNTNRLPNDRKLNTIAIQGLFYLMGE